MCQIYNEVGALTYIKNTLKKNKFDDFETLEQIIVFQRNFDKEVANSKLLEENVLRQEVVDLEKEISKLKTQIEQNTELKKQQLDEQIKHLEQDLQNLEQRRLTNFIEKMVFQFKRWLKSRKHRRLKTNYEKIIKKYVRSLQKKLDQTRKRYDILTNEFDKILEKNVNNRIKNLERKKKVFDELIPFVYGAFGEQKVVEVLKKLPDDYYLINDFKVNFKPGLYNKSENYYINSVQMDHILIGPGGVFLIETKNWSEESLDNLNLRSPVEQIRRANYALFRLLNNEIRIMNLRLNFHHWGQKKVSPKNLLVLTNVKPSEEFQFVKVLALNELLSYINFFKPTFTPSEVQQIAEFLLRINNSTLNGSGKDWN